MKKLFRIGFFGFSSENQKWESKIANLKSKMHRIPPNVLARADKVIPMIGQSKIQNQKSKIGKFPERAVHNKIVR